MGGIKRFKGCIKIRTVTLRVAAEERGSRTKQQQQEKCVSIFPPAIQGQRGAHILYNMWEFAIQSPLSEAAVQTIELPNI